MRLPSILLGLALGLFACEPVEIGGEMRAVSVADSGSGDAALIDAGSDASAAEDASAVVDSGSASDSGAEDSGVEDAGVQDAGAEDAGVEDAGAEDSGVDAGVQDAGAEDSGVEDAGAEDSGVEDAGVQDSGSTDSGVEDSGSTDSGVADSGTSADAGSEGDSGTIYAPQIVFTAGGSIQESSEPFTARGDAHGVRFVHQSTGKIIYNADGGVADAYTTLRPDDTIAEVAGPLEVYGDDPEDYEEAWLAKDGLSKITEDIVVFKNCYVSDPTLNLDDRERIYNELKTRFHSETYSAKTFISWTIPPMTATEFAKSSGNADNAREFYRWMLEDWDEPGDNIFIFDYRILATRGRDRFAEEDAIPEDSHPNSTFAAKVAPCFARRIAEVANGDGDTTSRTGGCTVR